LINRVEEKTELDGTSTFLKKKGGLAVAQRLGRNIENSQFSLSKKGIGIQKREREGERIRHTEGQLGVDGLKKRKATTRRE